MNAKQYIPRTGDALFVVDVQNDFLPGGRLAVPDGDAVVPVLNNYIEVFSKSGLSVFASRDWHPKDHCSFREQGGLWPPHCIAASEGAGFARDLHLPPTAQVISKATSKEMDNYSAFEVDDLAGQLRDMKINRLFIGGLATDYCVLNTVRDALAYGFTVVLLGDAIRSVNVHPDDGLKAEEQMIRLGATRITLQQVTE